MKLYEDQEYRKLVFNYRGGDHRQRLGSYTTVQGTEEELHGTDYCGRKIHLTLCRLVDFNTEDELEAEMARAFQEYANQGVALIPHLFGPVIRP